MANWRSGRFGLPLARAGLTYPPDINSLGEDRPMGAIGEILILLLNVAFFIMIVHIVFSWLITFQVLNMRQPLVANIWDGLNRLLEPVYRPIRNFLPNTGGLDLAPLVAFLIVIILRDILVPRIFFAF